MKILKITSPESLDAKVAEAVRLKISLVALTAEMETDKAAVEKRYASRIGVLNDDIAETENHIQDYCIANREQLFTDPKSRDTLTAVIGFEFTPYRVEPARKKITMKEIVKRLKGLVWGKDCIRTKEEVNKEELLSLRETLTADDLIAAGITFERDEQFFIRPKSQVAEATVVKEAA